MTIAEVVGIAGGDGTTLRVVLARGLSSMATFAVLPYIAVVILDGHLATPSVAATLVGVYVLCLRAGGFISAPVVQLLRRSRPLPVLYFAAAAFLLAGILTTELGWPLPVLAGALFANALAVAVANVLTKAAMAAELDDRRRVLGFGALSRAINGGAAVGALVGSFTAHHGTLAVFVPAMVLAGLAGAACSSIHDVGRPRVGLNVKVEGGQWIRRITFVVATATVWLAYVQFFAVLPIYARGSAAAGWVGLVFAINAVMVVVLQRLVLDKTATLFATPSRQWLVYMVACGCMTGALALLCAIRTTAWPLLFLAIVLLSMSELFWSPLLDSWTASVFGPRNLLAAYTITGLAWGGAEAAASSFSIPIATGAVTGIPWYGAILMSGVLVMGASFGLRAVVVYN